VAGRLATEENDRVHRAEGGGVGGELVEVVEHELLAGVCDVEPVKTRQLRGV
jgi:hypothetical protein